MIIKEVCKNFIVGWTLSMTLTKRITLGPRAHESIIHQLQTIYQVHIKRTQSHKVIMKWTRLFLVTQFRNQPPRTRVIVQRQYNTTIMQKRMPALPELGKVHERIHTRRKRIPLSDIWNYNPTNRQRNTTSNFLVPQGNAITSHPQVTSTFRADCHR